MGKGYIAEKCEYHSLKETIDISNKNSSENPDYVKTGLDTLDVITNGWMSGELCVFGARPCMGKTAFVLGCISGIVSDQIPVALISSSDSPNERFMLRVVAAIRDETRHFSHEQMKKFIQETDMSNVPLYMCFERELTLSYIKNSIEDLIREKNIRCVFIETIQSIFVSEKDGDTREGMDRVCHELKSIALEFNIPIIVTSELNRYPENREGYYGKAPVMTDLRSSSAIEQEADSVYLFWRPEYYGILEDEQHGDLHGIGKMIIAKNTNGPTFELTVGFDSSIGVIEDMPENRKNKIEKKIGQRDFEELVKSNEAIQELVDKFELKPFGDCPY